MYIGDMSDSFGYTSAAVRRSVEVLASRFFRGRPISSNYHKFTMLLSQVREKQVERVRVHTAKRIHRVRIRVKNLLLRILSSHAFGFF